MRTIKDGLVIRKTIKAQHISMREKNCIAINGKKLNKEI
jgi:hypothetical protein